MKVKMKKLIAGALVVCVTVVLVAVAIIRHVNHKQDVAWCHDHGYAKYATKDSFCVGAGGKLIKVGFSVYCGPVLRHLAGPSQAANFRSAIAF
jgi:hypothetical protein